MIGAYLAVNVNVDGTQDPQAIQILEASLKTPQDQQRQFLMEFSSAYNTAFSAASHNPVKK